MRLPQEKLDQLAAIANKFGQHVAAAAFGKSQAWVSKTLKANGINVARRGGPIDQRGDKNPNWKGGTSRATVWRRVGETLSEHGLNKDRCSNCGSTENVGVHHIDGDTSNNDVSNLAILCNWCHNTYHIKPRDPDTGRFQ